MQLKTNHTKYTNMLAISDRKKYKIFTKSKEFSLKQTDIETFYPDLYFKGKLMAM